MMEYEMLETPPSCACALPDVPGSLDVSNGWSSCQHSRVDEPSCAPMAVTLSFSEATGRSSIGRAKAEIARIILIFDLLIYLIRGPANRSEVCMYVCTYVCMYLQVCCVLLGGCETVYVIRYLGRHSEVA